MSKFRFFGLSLLLALMTISYGDSASSILNSAADVSNADKKQEDSEDVARARKQKEKDVALVKEILADVTDDTTDDEKIEIYKKHCDKENIVACDKLFIKLYNVKSKKNSAIDIPYLEKILNIKYNDIDKFSSSTYYARVARDNNLNEIESKFMTKLEQNCQNGNLKACSSILEYDGDVDKESIKKYYFDGILKECEKSGNESCLFYFDKIEATQEFFDELIPILTKSCDEKNNPFACYTLASIYREGRSGHNMIMVESKAKEYMSKAEKFAVVDCKNSTNGVVLPYSEIFIVPACDFIANFIYLYEFKNFDVNEVFKNACTNGASNGCLFYAGGSVAYHNGNVRHDGISLLDSSDEEIKYADRACTLKHIRACNALQEYYKYKDENKHKEYKEKSCELSPFSCLD